MSLHVEQTPATAEANPYLEGPYSATHDEVTLHDLEVLAGEIPDDLNGVYVRNGPNPQHDPIGRYHWFDGDGMVHAAALRRRDARPTATAGCAPRASAPSATPGPRSGTASWSRSARTPPATPEKDTANTDLVFHRDRLLALWYRAGKPYALDPVTLETLGPHDFDGTLRCEVSAHAKVDEDTGELMFFDYGVKPPYMRYGVVGPDGDGAPLRADRPARPAPAARHGDHRSATRS